MKNILLVDDDKSVRALLKSLLEDEGYAVEQAGDGKSALESFRRRLPDIVVTDIVMPEREGLETIMEMRRINSHIKIIAMSGGGRHTGPSNYLNLAKDLGADYIIEKPFALSDFLVLVAKASA